MRRTRYKNVERDCLKGKERRWNERNRQMENALYQGTR